MGEGDEKPALQVIVLGSGGGPVEDNTTAYLVRSTASGWKRGSVLAVDAGVHLSAVKRIIEEHMPLATGDYPNKVLTTGPFAGVELRHKSVLANAADFTRTMVDTYLITHPHLDHISGFVVNTAGLPGSKPKRLAGLPATIAAFRTHIFNNVIWPNLSDENNGAGLVTYMRLVDGGSPAIGDGDGKGYVEICDGLSTRPMSVSHGHCLERHTHRGSNAGMSPSSPHSGSNTLHPRRMTLPPERYTRQNSITTDEECVYDSSAYFIRDMATSREVLIFGDVEPDSISLSPRNLGVWREAAPKIASGTLSAIFIECSYAGMRDEDHLYGHLTPRYLIEEMITLASCVIASAHEQEREPRKRKRSSNRQHGSSEAGPSRRSHRNSGNGSPQISDFQRSPLPRIKIGSNSSSRSPSSSMNMDGDTSIEILDSSSPSNANIVDRSASAASDTGRNQAAEGCTSSPPTTVSSSMTPLKGVKIVIVHVKDDLEDNPPAGESILKELREKESSANLGCEFVLAKRGMSVYV